MSPTATKEREGENARKEAERPKRGVLRTNVEAFTVAIVMALVIKQFAAEAFQVPTESMEPTIIGRTDSGDRIVVDKLAYLLRSPERFDVAVFRYPLSRLLNYVKRVIGLPGETIRIAHGDIYVAKSPEGPFTLARKPDAIREATLRENPIYPPLDRQAMDTSLFREWWDIPTTGARFQGPDFILEGPERLVTVGTANHAITIERHDQYARDRRGRADETSGTSTGELRIGVEVTPDSGSGSVILTILDATLPLKPIRLDMAVAGSGRRSRLRFGDEELCADTLGDVMIPAGESTRLALENVDDRIRVTVDGEIVASWDYDQPKEDPDGHLATAAFGLDGGKASFHDVRLERDIYYTQYPGASGKSFVVPQDHYFFLGDNSPNSLDARGWRVIGIRLREDGRVLLGDLEAVSDDFEAPRQASNPWLEEGESGHRFLDIQGNPMVLEPGSYDILDLNGFPNPDGIGILEMHDTLLPDPRPGQVALPQVETPLLQNLTHASRSSPFQAYSVLMHFVPGKDVLGQAGFVWWPLGRWGLIR